MIGSIYNKNISYYCDIIQKISVRTKCILIFIKLSRQSHKTLSFEIIDYNLSYCYKKLYKKRKYL